MMPPAATNLSVFKINPAPAGKVTSAAAVPTAEPVVGAWYCAMHWDAQMQQYNGGVLAEYVGDGQFFDDDTEYTGAMRDADYIQQQC